MVFINRAVTFAALIGGFVALIISFVYMNALVLLASVFMFMFSLLIWKYGYLLIPMLTRATNVIEVRGSYEVPPTRDYVMKKDQNGYYATKFLEVKFYESSMDKSQDEKKTMFESFEKAISSLKYVVKISLMISALDLSGHLDDIKTRRSAAETKKSKTSQSSSDEQLRTDREIAMWNRLLDRITQGERPVELVAFASTTAFGLTRDEALSRVSRQSKEIKTILSSSLGCDIRELADTDMLKCFEWDFFFPTTNEEMRDELF